ncbi:HlyD family secretion protein [Ruegeria atlantica]|uniref:Inner membrane protein YiaV n=1 Tax=Ruegeria atlantica TaxID=81569 RepID=A0A0P1EE94_9RHOB|nr:biotin/lipoyl-binding protein [Ruegeria atlantica]CUH44473.1 Inner membrane protein YiaV precursor [Ruegeria atlantica]CUH47801.1 Inner membrane protein YiaV precursor [Ruegeria atlantica]
MLIILAIYFGIIWLLFFQLKLFSWSRTSKIIVALVGLGICLYVIAQLNTKTPSGRIAVMGVVVEIAPSVDGEVIEVPAIPNQAVNAGDVLFRIDPEPFKAAVKEAEADVEIASLTLNRQQTVFDRNPGLSVSEQDIDESRATLDAAEARLEAARFDLEETTIRAPQDGIVTSVNLSPGNQVSSSASVMPFIESGSFRMVGVFSQNGSGALMAGTPVELIFEAVPGTIFTSSVFQVVPGTAGGQIPVSSNLLSATSVGSDSEVLLLLEWPDGLPKYASQPGMVGSATAYGPDAGPFEILAKVLVRIRALLTYL